MGSFTLLASACQAFHGKRASCNHQQPGFRSVSCDRLSGKAQHWFVMCRVSSLDAGKRALEAAVQEQAQQAEEAQQQQAECIAILEAHIVELATRAAQVDGSLTGMQVCSP
jgi:hypothetical protein